MTAWTQPVEGRVALIEADVLDALASIPDETVDAVCTDPPYGLAFMGKAWDAHPSPDAFQKWCLDWGRECLRVLKPGGHLLAFGGTRTYHRLACAVEDAGFEIRDSVMWLYGQGFPKSLNVGKAIDKAAGAEREVIGIGKKRTSGVYAHAGNGRPQDAASYAAHDVPTAPATELARQWEGWGTALKPAFEPVVVARKPFKGTVAANVLAYGTGAINVDGCRIGMSDADREVVDRRSGAGSHGEGWGHIGDFDEGRRFTSAAAGRWPANVVLSHLPGCVEVGERVIKGTKGVPQRDLGVGTGEDSRYNFGDTVGRNGERVEFAWVDESGHETIPAYECEPGCPVADLDAQSGTVGGGRFTNRETPYEGDPAFVGGTFRSGSTKGMPTLDAGGASRFFYVAKASSRERPKVNGVAHATVKPLALMRWLVRLVTPPDGLVLDCFAGSGTTGEAALLEGMRCYLVEREADYIPLIEARMARSVPVEAAG